MNVQALIERYNDARNAHDVDTVASMHHPDIVFHNHTADERAEGADVVRAHIARIFENNPDLSFATRSLRVGDDLAVCEWTAR
ncbi:MAG: nuclear transport factor 2 family protein, partial [Gaiellaceae bacterium]